MQQNEAKFSHFCIFFIKDSPFCWIWIFNFDSNEMKIFDLESGLKWSKNKQRTHLLRSSIFGQSCDFFSARFARFLFKWATVSLSDSNLELKAPPKHSLLVAIWYARDRSDFFGASLSGEEK